MSKLVTTQQKCKRCSYYVKAHNEYFLRCPNCALLAKRGNKCLIRAAH